MNGFYILGWVGVIYLVLYAIADFLDFIYHLSHGNDDDEQK